ncbi:hypothetical protein [Maribacter aurantiacus]|nr:hypothetical protein [Maribacter aurantiacus]
MKTKKWLVAVVIVAVNGLFVSCEKESTTEDESLYEQSIDKDEIKEGDVM